MVGPNVTMSRVMQAQNNLLLALEAAPVSRVRLSALTFKHAAPTYMEDYAVGSGGDYSLYQGGVVHMNGTANCKGECVFKKYINVVLAECRKNKSEDDEDG